MAGSILKIIVPQVMVKNEITIIAKILIINPVLIICAIVSFPVLKAMAFGGVAIGNINAKEAASVTGIIISKGLIPISFAKPLITGKIISVVAVFEVNSVSIDINPVNVPINSVGDNALAPDRRLPA